MTGLLAGLERSGLVKRDEHPEDRRMLSIELTEAALDLFERILPERDKVRELLSGIDGLELVRLERPDECCGFGGAFSIDEEAVSCRMGRDRVQDHERAGAEVITAGDMSCLMHLQGLIRRDRKPLRILHLAELLAEAEARP